jgi:methyl-accepting chemotaxis protein
MDLTMLNRLNTKLLLPTAIVGVLFIFLLLVIGNDMEKGTVIVTLSSMLAVQLTASFLFSQKVLANRLAKLKDYLDAVVSTNRAPEQPLHDVSNDDLAEISNQLSNFIVDLSGVVTDLKAESETLKQGAQSLSSQMIESVNAVDESGNQISQMANSIEQIALTSATLSESALQVSETTSRVMSILAQGTNSSDTNQKTIASCAQEVNGTADELALLQEESARIGSVLDVIRGIADQTNLLALNAAIEAARAGEQGRGFAVVADEVRALAHRTQESTVEIQSMVEGLQEKSKNAVDAISRGQALTQESLTHSEEVVNALVQIGDVFSEVDNLTSQIASGTDEQQQSTSSINSNMTTIVALSQNINEGLSSVAQHAEKQEMTTTVVDKTLNRICV